MKTTTNILLSIVLLSSSFTARRTAHLVVLAHEGECAAAATPANQTTTVHRDESHPRSSTSDNNNNHRSSRSQTCRAPLWSPVVSPAEEELQQQPSTTTPRRTKIKNLDHATCQLYLARSQQPTGTLGLFAGDRSWDVDEIVTEPDLIFSLPDINRNEFSPWQDVSWPSDVIPGMHLETSLFLHELILPGLASVTPCPTWEGHVNVLPDVRRHGWASTLSSTPEQLNITAPPLVLQDSVGVHRSSHATAGSFSYYAGYAHRAVHPIAPGQELIQSCLVRPYVPPPLPSQFEQPDGRVEYDRFFYERPSRTLSELHESGVCVDALTVGPSTLPGVGRGAFSQRSFAVGDRITTTPLVHFDRSQLFRLEQEYKQELPLMRDHGIQYTRTTPLWEPQQLLLNYAYGHPDSTVLLLPLGLSVNSINHDRERANAVIRWSTADGIYDTTYPLLSMSHYDILELHGVGQTHQLAFDIVALQEIAPGDEIFIDYGDEWVQAWEEHVAKYSQHMNSSNTSEYIAASDYKRQHAGELILTLQEQQSDPYPENITTACYFLPLEEDSLGERPVAMWSEDRLDCVRPCKIMERYPSGGDDGGGENATLQYYYTALVFSQPGAVESYDCGRLPDGGVTVTNIPSYAVTLIDQPYTTDVFLPHAFRHEIGVPDGMYPDTWMMTDPMPKGDFIPSRLSPGELEPIRWADTGEVVTENAYLIGMNPRVRHVLLDYCNKMGITDIFKQITMDGNALEIGTNTYMELDGTRWFVQRSVSKWL